MCSTNGERLWCIYKSKFENMNLINKLALRLDGYRDFEEYWKENSSGQSFRDSQDLIVIILTLIGCFSIMVIWFLLSLAF